MAELIGKMQTQFKKTSIDFVLFGVKLISGALLGLTVALVAEVMLGHGEGENMLVFVFVAVATVGVFMRLAKSWGLTAVLVFDLICVLVAMLLRLYIMVAPDA